MRKFKRHYRSIPTPDPDDCILEIVNTQLVVSRMFYGLYTTPKWGSAECSNFLNHLIPIMVYI